MVSALVLILIGFRVSVGFGIRHRCGASLRRFALASASCNLSSISVLAGNVSIELHLRNGLQTPGDLHGGFASASGWHSVSIS
jgi:hypothetical protein